MFKKKLQAFKSVGRRKKDALIISRVSDLIEAGFNTEYLMEEFVRINKEVWSGITQDNYIWTKEMVSSHFKTCPYALFCAFENNKLVATLTTICLFEEDMVTKKSWLDKTGNGFLTTHTPHGTIGFGVDLSVQKNASGKVSDNIVLAALFIGLLGEGLKAVYVGSRIPSYHKHKDIEVEKYVYGLRKSGKPLDPELYFYLKNGFEIVEIIPDYMDDPASLNYGVLIKWENPLYRITRTLPVIKWIIKRIGEKIFLKLPILPESENCDTESITLPSGP